MNNTVIVSRCEEYDHDAIREIVAAGAKQLGYRPAGKVFVKPNVVYATGPVETGACTYTHPALLGASVEALAQAAGVQRIDVSEKCGVGVPTRFCYRKAGYYETIRKVKRSVSCPLTLRCMEEELRDDVFVGGAVHDKLRVARSLARADSKVYLPKLKCHCVSSMTGAVKLNIGICCDDDRSIRHDFLLDEKIVDLLEPGRPDFVVMDAIDVGVGNEVHPKPRKLGLVLMGLNPLAVDLVGARLLGFNLEEVPYLKKAVERGYAPSSLEQVEIAGDLGSIADVDEAAKRLLPYDDEYTAWQDIAKDLELRQSPIRFYWGPYREGGTECLTGCVMGLKMLFASLESWGGAEAFKHAKPVVFVIGKVEDEIDARGAEAVILGSCARANIVGAKRVTHIKKCFTTASDMTLSFGHRLGMPIMTRDASFMAGYIATVLESSLRKTMSMRYAQDIARFFSDKLTRSI